MSYSRCVRESVGVMYICCVCCFCCFFFVFLFFVFFLMIRRPPRSTLDRSSAASDVYKRQVVFLVDGLVADHGPAGGLHHLDVEAVFRIEAERRGHDDRRRAGDRYLSLIHISEPTRPY